MPGVTGLNANDFLKGALARLQCGLWVTGGGAATLIDCGSLMAPQIDFGRDIKLVEVDNCTFALEAYTTKSTATCKGQMVEGALRKLAMAMGDDPTATTGDVGVLSGSATYAIDEPPAERLWQVVLTVAGQSMKPAYTEFASDVYIKRTYTFYKGKMKPKISQSFKKNAETVIPFEIDFLLDTTVTYTKGSQGRIGKIVDSTS